MGNKVPIHTHLFSSLQSHVCQPVPMPQVVMRISSDRDDQKNFFGFEIFDSGICWIQKFGKYFFG